MRILVTGGRGFIASYAVQEAFLKGYEVKTYDLLDGQDIVDFDQLEETVKEFAPQWILHLAAQVNLAPSIANPQFDAYTNIIGTINVLETAKRHNCGVTISSSGAVYGNNYQYPDPISPYGISKLTAEDYCRYFNKMYNLPTVIFRFSSIYGKGRAPTSINLIVQKAMRGEPITITSNGEQTRDFTYVKDVAEALVMSGEGKFPSGTYDIGTGTATSLNRLIQVLEKLLQKRIVVEYTNKEVKGDPKRNELNVNPAAMCGWKARTSLEEGLKELIRLS